MIKIFAILLLVAGASSADQDRISIADLQALYLDCELRAQAGRLAGADASGCSVIYEELKSRAFGGDFRRLNAWFEQARTAEGST